MAANTIFDRAMNDVSAGAYITDTKIPVLRVGDTVILDSLSACKVAEVRKPSERSAHEFSISRPRSRPLTPLKGPGPTDSDPANWSDLTGILDRAD